MILTAIRVQFFVFKLELRINAYFIACLHVKKRFTAIHANFEVARPLSEINQRINSASGVVDAVGSSTLLADLKFIQ